MEEKVMVSILLEIYGSLLTEKQFEFMNYYYNQDLSLSEIGDNYSITRQAVRTILLKSKKKLQEYEEKLKFMQKQEKMKIYLKKIESTELDKNQKGIIKDINNLLDF